jgi:hypothetical protein
MAHKSLTAVRCARCLFARRLPTMRWRTGAQGAVGFARRVQLPSILDACRMPAVVVTACAKALLVDAPRGSEREHELST